MRFIVNKPLICSTIMNIQYETFYIECSNVKMIDAIRTGGTGFNLDTANFRTPSVTNVLNSLLVYTKPKSCNGKAKCLQTAQTRYNLCISRSRIRHHATSRPAYSPLPLLNVLLNTR